MKSRKVMLVVGKDLRECLGNKLVVLPMIVLPLVLCVAVPTLMVALGLSSGTYVVSGAQAIERILPLYRIPERFPGTVERLLYVFLNYTMMPFFFMIPIMVSSIIAANSVAGEKERRTLETLLYTPVSNREFVAGKLLSAFLPAMAASAVSFAIYFLAANGVYLAMRGATIVESASWIPALLVLTPAASLFALASTLLVSIKAKSFIEAQQAAGLVVLPCVLLVAAQVGGLVVISPLAVAAGGAALLALDCFLVLRVAPRFDREKLLSCV